jgi:flavin-binding protein dodecin
VRDTGSGRAGRGRRPFPSDPRALDSRRRRRWAGIARAHQTLRNVRSAWIKEQQVRVKDGAITDFQVNMMVTFVIDD